MSKHKPILFATDLSARCDRPLDRAIMLAEQWQADVNVLHILDRSRTKDSEAMVLALKERLEAELPSSTARISAHVMLGFPGKKITNIAKAKDYGLIILGVSHYNSLGRIVLGSTVDHVVRHCRIPVLIVKRRPLQPYQGMVVGTDYSEGSITALNTAARLFPTLPIHVVHSYEPPYQAWLKSQDVADHVTGTEQAEMHAFLADTQIAASDYDRITSAVERGTAGEVINASAQKQSADLIVLGAHGRSGIISDTIGAQARHLLEHLHHDILLVRADQ